MKPKGLYEIHALIGRCHLHTKKKATYSITLKMGSKVSASTQYKLPINDEVNFNNELILKIDKSQFQGSGKLSIIVTMLTEQKEKKIIGSTLANFKQKGLQTHKVSQCSCKEQGFEVNVEFEIVNIQNQNNNPNNNKIQSANNSEMKDLKKTLTMSREKQMVKSSRAKQSTGTKSPAQKTQPKLNKQKIEKHLNDEVSQNLSSLTTKITPSHIKLNQQTRQIVSQLKDKIGELEYKLRDSVNSEKSHRKQLTILQNQVDLLQKENQCLLEILKFEEEKSSAAISYVTFLSKKIAQNVITQNQCHQYFQLIETIQKDNTTDTTQAIKAHKNKSAQDMSFEFKPIQEKEEINEQNTEKLILQIQNYKILIEALRQKIIDLQAQETEKSESIIYLETQINQTNKQNIQLKSEIDKLQKTSKDYQYEIKTLQVKNKQLDTELQQLEKSLTQINAKYQKAYSQINEISKLNCLKIKEIDELKYKLAESQQKIATLKEFQLKYEQLSKQKQIQKVPQPKTPFQSEIILRKSRFQEGDQIQNLINQMNSCPKSKNNKQLLLTSRQAEQPSHFLSKNKSASLLKDMQINFDSQDPNTEQTSNELHKGNYDNKKKISIPEHKKQAQKYNYEYDIDSLNYFNNFQEGHEAMELSGTEDNACEMEVDVNGVA